MTSRGRTPTSVSATSSTSNARAALAIFAGALVLRIIHIWQIRHAPFFGLLFGDARAYDEWARRIAAGDWIGSEVFYQAPLYPYLLGCLDTIAGQDLLLVRLVQAVAGSAACVLVMLAGQRLFDRRTGILAGALLAIYAPAIFFDGLIQKASLDAFLVSLLLYVATRVIEKPSDVRLWFGFGIVTGGLCLSRENALILLPVIGVWIWCETRLSAPRRRTMAAAMVCGVALLLAPVAARNFALGGGFLLTTSQLGTNLYIGNHPGGDGTYQALRTGRGTPEFERVDATALASRAEGRALTPGEVSSYWTRQALAFVRSEPVAWAKLMGRKVLLLLNRVEVVDTESLESHAEWSWPLRVGRWVGHFGVLVPLALVGMWNSRRTLRRAWLVPAMMGTYAVSVVAFYVLARYRYPLVPFLVMPAAAALTTLPRFARESTRGEQAALAAGLALAALLTNWPLLSSTAMQAVSETNLGVALQTDGQTSEALRHYQRAVALRGNDPVPYVNMGTLLHAQGRTGEASALFAQALAIRPDFGEAHYFLAKTLIEQDRTAEAISHLHQAVTTMPDSTDVRTSLGIVLASQGRFDEAIDAFRTVTRMSPASATARWNLGSALAATGRFDEAVTELEESVRLDPDHMQARQDLAAARQLRDETRAATRR